MQQLMRMTCSGVIGFFITLALFLGMMKLLGNRSTSSEYNEFDFTISYVKPEVETNSRKRHKKKPPELEKSTQPPATPKINVNQNNNRILNFPNEFEVTKNLNILDKISLPGLNYTIAKPGNDSRGGVKSSIAPMYPLNALMKGTQGSVEVLITVNEMGLVERVKVLNSNPARVFDDAAIKTVNKWKFYRKEEYGKAIPYQLKQTIEFKIKVIEVP